MPLSANQKRYLRGLAHGLNPVIMVGQKGITDTLIQELERALDHHELVKVKLAGEDRETRSHYATELSVRTGAELIQAIGHTICYYKCNNETPKLALPK